MNMGKVKTPYTKQGQTRGPHLMIILEDVARHFKVLPGDAIILDKGKEILLTRGIYCYVAWKLTNATLREIAALLDVHHTDVIYHRDKVAYWIKNADPKWVDEWLDYLETSSIWGQYEKLR